MNNLKEVKEQPQQAILGLAIGIVPKGLSGWISKLNPLNWRGLRTYEGDIETAYDAAKANKDKKFLWNGIRFSVDYTPVELPSQENLGYEDWTDQQHENMRLRLLKNSKVQSKNLSIMDNNRDVFKQFGLQTTPQRDSTWTYLEGDGVNPNKDIEAIIFKNSDTNDYIYNYKGPDGFTETRVSKLPDKIQQLVNIINNETVRK